MGQATTANPYGAGNVPGEAGIIPIQISQQELQYLYPNYGSDPTTTMPWLDDYCNNTGMDFLVQIPLDSCTPTVIRSDLLEEQNVQVLCKLTGIKINPLLDVTRIKSIQLTEATRSEDIIGITYYPPRTALSYYSYQQGQATQTTSEGKILGLAEMNNLGYVLILIRQQPSEAKMPSSIISNLTLRITYDTSRTYGTEENQFILPILNQNEWVNDYNEYSFWRGKGYIRLMELTDNKAKLAIYTNPQSSPIKTIELTEGQTYGGEIRLPGFYCQAGLKPKLEKITTPQKRVSIYVDGVEQLAENGDTLGNSGCRISDISPSEYGYGGEVRIFCSGNKEIILKISDAQAELKIQGEIGTKKVLPGDKLTIQKQGSTQAADIEEWYVGYIGREYLQISTSSGQTTVQGIDNVTILYNWTNKKDSALVKKINKAIQDYMEKLHSQGSYRIGEAEIAKEITTKISSLEGIIKTADIKVIYGSQTTSTSNNINGRTINLVGVTGPVQAVYEKETEQLYSETINYYKDIAGKYTDLDSKEGTKYGIIALREAAEFAKDFHKNVDAIDLLNLIESKYSSSKDSDVLKEIEEIKKEILMNLQISGENRATAMTTSGEHSFELKRFYKPGIEDLSASLRINDIVMTGYVIGDKIGSEGLWEIKSITENSVTVVNITDMMKTQVISKDQGFIYLPQNSGAPIKISFVSAIVKKEVKVTILPFNKERITYSNFTLQIGIEKRAIKLSTDKTKELISKIDSTIKQIDSINSKLEKLTTTWKKACLVGATALWVKNFAKSITGEGYARRLASEQWVIKCSDGKFRDDVRKQNNIDYELSFERCMQLKEKEINSDVKLMESALKNTNNLISSIKSEKNVLKKSGLFGMTSTIDEVEFFKSAQNKLKSNTEIYNLVFNSKNVNNQQVSENTRDFTDNLPSYQEYSLITSSQFKDYILEFYLKIDCDKNKPAESMICTEQREQGTYVKLKDLRTRNDDKKLIAGAQKGALENGLGIRFVPSYSAKNQLEITAQTSTLNSDSASKFGLKDPNKYVGEEATIAAYTDEVGKTKTYLLILEIQGITDASQKRYNIKEIYELQGNEVSKDNQGNPIDIKGKPGSPPFAIVLAHEITKCRNNQMSATDAKIRFWDTGAYAGLISFMPIDRASGYYFATKGPSIFETTNNAWKASGDIQTYYICNVGSDKIASWTADGPQGDDIQCCIEISSQVNINDIVLPGYEYDSDGKRKSLQIIEQAKKCSKEAIAARLKGDRKITTACGTYDLGQPLQTGKGTSCEEFMSPSDCKLLYNLCDPVMCPKSRCDYDGRYPVDNVIQSGIIGSLILCSPNFDNGKGVIMPVCLTGLNAGLDSLNSVLKSSRDCLQEQLASGKTVGICDYIQSVYLCELMWKELDPLLKTGLPSIVESATNKGGGEYALFSESWSNSLDSARYFTDYYGLETFKSFKARSAGQSTAEICKKFVSIAYPTQAQFFNQFAKVDSPPQAFASFQEISTGGTTPQSHYKVFYHIYAGKDSGVFYSIYLKSPTTQGYYTIPETYIVRDAYGFLNAGETVSKTPDFYAPSGYKEVCIKINDQEICGFGQATTNFAIDEVKNYYLENQLKKDVTKASDCVSGSSSIIPIPTLNIQQAVESMSNPELYKQGIVRVCSSTNPGGIDAERWVNVGYCDNQAIGCWLDTNSVKESITDKKIVNELITEKQAEQIANMIDTEGYSTLEQTKKDLSSLETPYKEIKDDVENAIAKYRKDMGVWYDKYIKDNNDKKPTQAEINDKSGELQKEKLGEGKNNFEDLKNKLTELESQYIGVKLKAFYPEGRADADLQIARIKALRANLLSQKELFIAEIVETTEGSAVGGEQYKPFTSFKWWPSKSNYLDDKYVKDFDKYKYIYIGPISETKDQEFKKIILPQEGTVEVAYYDSKISHERNWLTFSIIVNHGNGIYTYYGGLTSVFDNDETEISSTQNIKNIIGKPYKANQIIGKLDYKNEKADYNYIYFKVFVGDYSKEENSKNPLCFFEPAAISKLHRGYPLFTTEGNALEYKKGILGKTVQDFLNSNECRIARGGEIVESMGCKEMGGEITSTCTDNNKILQFPIESEDFANKIDPFNYPGMSEYNSNYYPLRYRAIHRGIDIYTKKDGVSVYSISSGEVIDDQGSCINIYSKEIDYTFVYCHVKKDSPIKKGDQIKIGQKIAVISYPSIPHLHLTTYKGKRVDSAPYSSAYSLCDCTDTNSCEANPKLGCQILNDDKFLVNPKDVIPLYPGAFCCKLQETVSKKCKDYSEEQSCNAASEGTTKCVWFDNLCGKCPTQCSSSLLKPTPIIPDGWFGTNRQFIQSECGTGKISNTICKLNCIWGSEGLCLNLAQGSSFIAFIEETNNKEILKIKIKEIVNDEGIYNQVILKLPHVYDSTSAKDELNSIKINLEEIKDELNAFEGKENIDVAILTKYKTKILGLLVVIDDRLKELTETEIQNFENYYKENVAEIIEKEFVEKGETHACGDFAFVLLQKTVEEYNSAKGTNVYLKFCTTKDSCEQVTSVECRPSILTQMLANYNTVKVNIESQIQSGDLLLYKPNSQKDYWHTIVIDIRATDYKAGANPNFRLISGTLDENDSPAPVRYYDDITGFRKRDQTIVDYSDKNSVLYTKYIQSNIDAYNREKHHNPASRWDFEKILRKSS